MGYTFENLEGDIVRLIRCYPQTSWGSIGKSCWGRELYYIRLGRGKKVFLYNGAHHGMESITSAMLMRFAEDFLRARHSGGSLGGYNAGELLKKVSLYIIPMVNPDGVELAVNGLPRTISGPEKIRLIEYNNGSDNFSSWQANARGVDLNHNYDAMWHLSRSVGKRCGICGPGPTRFPGEAPLSEAESRSLVQFTREKCPRLVIAFHSQGKVIYQGFMGKEPTESQRIARGFEIVSPYKIDKPSGMASYGGYKDWFVKEFRRPGYTVEVGEGENPLNDENLPIIYKETLPILMGALTV